MMSRGRTQILALILLVVFWESLHSAESSIAWYGDIQEASRLAQQANKPMMLDFWASWCAPCKIMEKEVYSDADVVLAASQKFLPVKVDFDHQEKLVRKYNISALPTIVFTDSYGTELFRHRGLIGAKALAELLQTLPADMTRINRFRQILSQDKENLEALHRLGEELQETELYRLSNEYYSRALKTEPLSREPRRRETILMAMGRNSLELREFKQAAGILERCVKEFPSSPNRPLFLLRLGQAYALAGAQDKARKVLATLMDQYPGTESARKAQGILEGCR